jgi:hypothetical protein
MSSTSYRKWHDIDGVVCESITTGTGETNSLWVPGWQIKNIEHENLRTLCWTLQNRMSWQEGCPTSSLHTLAWGRMIASPIVLCQILMTRGVIAPSFVLCHAIASHSWCCNARQQKALITWGYVEFLHSRHFNATCGNARTTGGLIEFSKLSMVATEALIVVVEGEVDLVGSVKLACAMFLSVPFNLRWRQLCGMQY